jgi:hypothetical protein
MTDEERRQAQVEALDEVHRLIHQELSKIDLLDANSAHDDPTNDVMVCGINRVGAAVNKLKFAILKKEISLPSIDAGGAMAPEDNPFEEIISGPIPAVDPNDLKSAWTMQEELKRGLNERFPDRDPNQAFSVSADHYKQACSPGANVMVVWYRLSQLELLQHMNKLGELTSTVPEVLLTDGCPSDAVFKALATVPMTGLQPGVNIEGPPFDVAVSPIDEPCDTAATFHCGICGQWVLRCACRRSGLAPLRP